MSSNATPGSTLATASTPRNRLPGLRQSQFALMTLLTFVAAMAIGSAARAQSIARPDQGKFLLTGGASSIDGAGGGGLTTWALITGYGTRDSMGGNLHYTLYRTQDYEVSSPGIAVGLADRLELSLAKVKIKGAGGPLDGVSIRQNVYGAKLKVAGDAVYDQDRWLPQIALGFQHKANDGGIKGLEALGLTRPTSVGAKKDRGTDYYLAATKIVLSQSLLLNGTLRFTKANQFGLLGFGGDRNNNHKPHFEGAVAYLFSRQLAVGAEYRSKPRNLGVDRERDAFDVFVAWAPNKNVSVVLAYLDVGPIVTGTGAGPGFPGTINPKKQNGAYLSVQAGF